MCALFFALHLLALGRWSPAGTPTPSPWSS